MGRWPVDMGKIGFSHSLAPHPIAILMRFIAAGELGR